MTVALIVVGVIIFLAFDAYVITKVMRRHQGADDLAIIEVPGETTVTVPPGKVRITYQEAKRAASDDDRIYFDTPDELEVEVSSATSGKLEIKAPGFKGTGSGKSTGGFTSTWSRTLIGTVEVPSADTLTITAGPELPDAVEPQVLVGP